MVEPIPLITKIIKITIPNFIKTLTAPLLKSFIHITFH